MLDAAKAIHPAKILAYSPPKQMQIIHIADLQYRLSGASFTLLAQRVVIQFKSPLLGILMFENLLASPDCG